MRKREKESNRERATRGKRSPGETASIIAKCKEKGVGRGRGMSALRDVRRRRRVSESRVPRKHVSARLSSQPPVARLGRVLRARVCVRARTSRCDRCRRYCYFPPFGSIPLPSSALARPPSRCVYARAAARRFFAREGSPSEARRAGATAAGRKGALTERRKGERERERERHRDRGAALVLIGPGHAIFTIRRHGHLATGRRSYLV